ncbi:LTA synthase family protein [Verticiella sediminum]|uniref:LTA synthase family protein n=1 Tax=Verticiella sediminum TaxID=1247510 RepID=A0A556APK5_9BURK|nr:LTA synthase family protein [Verticiella sediminum]TSH94828.1 LTA synthase family protein [Verticiella sediminum]
MYSQTLTFLLASFLLLSASRLALIGWQRQRVRAVRGLWPLLLGGLRIDAHLVALAAAVPLTLAPWLGDAPLAIAINAVWLQFAWLLIVLLEVSTPQFVDEYDTRPNRLYIAYLQHPREVLTMLWRGYRASALGAIAGVAVFALLGHWLFAEPQWRALPDAWWAKAGLSLLAVLASFLAIRGTLRHRPINPSTVAFCGDALVNALALNSLYSVMYAAYCLKNERSSADAYGDLPADVVQQEVARAAGLPPPAPDAAIPTLHRHGGGRPAVRPRNLVIIVEESLGAQFVAHLGGRALTPELDALAEQGWDFVNAYATGTRSVRGLEALVAGFPPSISEAVLRLPNAQSRFFTLAQALREQGYVNRFVYGGEAHFDNMRGFFLGNGFDELYDLKTFENPAFVGTWGASDEDMFARLHELLSRDDERPSFTLAFSVSNHTPWEYPAGRIRPEGAPATVENTVRYADWALGRFFEQARACRYWDDTVFLVAADHDARVGGCERVPLRHFHIPALILGGSIAPRRDTRLISQIDLPVTLLSLIGVDCEHPMIGHDLTRDDAGGRALMQYGEAYGYLKADTLTVLEPHQPAVQFRYAAPDGYTPLDPDAALVREALAHALWADTMYRQRLYTLPHLRIAAPGQAPAQPAGPALRAG